MPMNNTHTTPTHHKAKRLDAGCYAYRGRIIERLYSEGSGDCWYTSHPETRESMGSPTDTLADAKWAVDMEIDGTSRW